MGIIFYNNEYILTSLAADKHFKILTLLLFYGYQLNAITSIHSVYINYYLVS